MRPSVLVHDFWQKLTEADLATPPESLDHFYRANILGVCSVHKIVGKGLQYRGGDTLVVLENGKPLLFDEKVRFGNWIDFLLEEYSIWPDYPNLNGHPIDEHQIPKGWKGVLTPGWLCPDKWTDYITYISKPRNEAWFLPFIAVQRAMVRNWRRWVEKYGRIEVPNKGYHTTNIPVPMAELSKWCFLVPARYESAA